MFSCDIAKFLRTVSLKNLRWWLLLQLKAGRINTSGIFRTLENNYDETFCNKTNERLDVVNCIRKKPPSCIFAEAVTRSVLKKKLFLENSQYFQENTCAGVSF